MASYSTLDHVNAIENDYPLVKALYGIFASDSGSSTVSDTEMSPGSCDIGKSRII